jgi:glycosyltransferase involved in cell wall biosynthesis
MPAQSPFPSRTPRISVVIPLLNEEESLRELASRLHEVLMPMTDGEYEVLFIDDGSNDNSYQVLQALHGENTRFHTIRFRRNYGKSAALAVGFSRAEGDIVITMDADLQDDPSELPALCEKIHIGYDLGKRSVTILGIKQCRLNFSTP